MTVATAPIDPRAHRWGIEQYLQIAESEALRGQRVELIDGDILDMAPQRDPHSFTVSRVARQLMLAFPEPFWVKIQATLLMGDDSAPEPDFAVLSGPPSPPADAAPKVLLVIEVSDASLRFDRETKSTLYASQGIEDYWIVNVAEQQVEVYRKPVADPQRRFGFGYSVCTVHRAGERVSPLVDPTISFDVLNLLP